MSAPSSPQAATSLTLAPDELVSKLIMGFVERRVAPQTIADVARSQLIEERVPVSRLSTPTCNGVLEVLTAAAQPVGDILDLLVAFADHPQFPRFLSTKAAVGAFCATLRTLEASGTVGPEHLLFPQLIGLLGGVSTRLLETARTLDEVERLRLHHALKTAPASTAACLPYLPSLACVHANFTQLKEPEVVIEPPRFPTPEEVIASIKESGDFVLSQRSVASLALHPGLEARNWRMRNIDSLLSHLQTMTDAPFHQSYLTEWFFDGALRATFREDDSTELLRAALAAVMRHAGGSLGKEGDSDAGVGVLKGLVRALHRDLGQISAETQATPAAESASDVSGLRLERALGRAQAFLLELIGLVEKGARELSRSFIPWALEVPVASEAHRLVTRRSWQWVRTMGYGIWEEDLRQPPAWLVAGANRYSARIFQIAPGFWLQDFAYLFLFQLYRESIVDGFVERSAHVDYVEFLARALKRRSPFFACRLEIPVALGIIGRAQRAEEKQVGLTEARLALNVKALDPSAPATEQEFWSRYFAEGEKAQEKLGRTPLTRALSLLVRAARDGAKVPAYVRSQGPR